MSGGRRGFARLEAGQLFRRMMVQVAHSASVHDPEMGRLHHRVCRRQGAEGGDPGAVQDAEDSVVYADPWGAL